MKFVINYFDNPIEILSDKVFSLEIENKSYFWRLVQEFTQISNGNLNENIILLDNFNNEIKPNIEIFIDYFNLNFNTKKNDSLITKMVWQEIDEISKEKITKKYKDIYDVISKGLIDIELPIKIDTEINIESLLNVIKLRLSMQDDLLSNLMLLIDIKKIFDKSTILLFINLKQFLSKDELCELYKYAIYNEVKIFLIDNQSYGTSEKNEKKLIIDCELAEFLV